MVQSPSRMRQVTAWSQSAGYVAWIGRSNRRVLSRSSRGRISLGSRRLVSVFRLPQASASSCRCLGLQREGAEGFVAGAETVLHPFMELQRVGVDEQVTSHAQGDAVLEHVPGRPPSPAEDVVSVETLPPAFGVDHLAPLAGPAISLLDQVGPEHVLLPELAFGSLHGFGQNRSQGQMIGL